MEPQIKFFRCDDIHSPVGDEGYIGGGSYGIVRYGFHPIHGVVAIKFSAMRGGIQKKNLLEKRIKSEIDTLQKANHENVVRVHGWTQWSGAIAIIMEYLPGGNLMEVLDDVDITLEPLLRLRMCYEISNGIAFLHNLSLDKRLVHGDIKAENILLTEDLHCKIADFGSAKLSSYTGGFTMTAHHERSNQFTVLYASPEVVANPSLKLQPSHDTYSFGVTVYMILGREIPVGAMNMLMYLESIKQGKRPSLNTINDFIQDLERENRTEDANAVDAMRSIMEECWKQIPSERPQMLDVKNALQKLLVECDPIKIQLHAVDAACRMDIKKLSRCQHECVSLDRFSAPEFRYAADSSKNFAYADVSSSTANDYSNLSVSQCTTPRSMPSEELNTLDSKSENLAKSHDRDETSNVFNRASKIDPVRPIESDINGIDCPGIGACGSSDDDDSDYFQCSDLTYPKESSYCAQNKSDRNKCFCQASNGRLKLSDDTAKDAILNLRGQCLNSNENDVNLSSVDEFDVVEEASRDEDSTLWALLLWLISIFQTLTNSISRMAEVKLQFVCYQNLNATKPSLLWKIGPLFHQEEEMDEWMNVKIGEAFKGVLSLRQGTEKIHLKLCSVDKKVVVKPAVATVDVSFAKYFPKQVSFFIEKHVDQTQFCYEIRGESKVLEYGMFHLPIIIDARTAMASSTKPGVGRRNITTHISKSVFHGSAIGSHKVDQFQRKTKSSPSLSKAFYHLPDEEESSDS